MALEDASLCTTCKIVFDNPPRTDEEYNWITYDLQGIADAAAQGCRVCICHHHALTTKYGSIGNLEHNSNLDVDLEYEYIKPRVLHIYSKGDQHNLSHYVYMQRNPPNKSFTVPRSLTARYTKDQRCLTQVSKWLQHCLGTHERCQEARLAHSYATFPARLLRIGKNALWLIRKEDLDDIESVHYMTLSHRWQTNITPKLLQNNHTAMQQAIDEESLPQTFQDAIFLARELDFNYLWIDALCIIQDDVTDLNREIALMGEIYQGALLNIGGLLDQGPTKETAVGLFTGRDPQHHTPFTINLRLKVKDVQVEYMQVRVYGSVAFEEIAKSPLMGRGWVLQERLLSPRSLYFGEQIHWECAESSACEAFPEKKAQPFFDHPRFGHSVPLRMATLLNHKATLRGAVDQEIDVYRSWIQVVEWFSVCRLSFEEDCFPALLGLQHRYAEVLQDEFLAGLWRRNIMNELVWFVKHDMQASGYQTYPKRYRAPSWSWASVVVPVGFLEHWHVNPRFPTKIDANVELAEIEKDGALTSGKISNGTLRISGHMIPSHERLCERKAPILGNPFSSYEVYDSGYYADGNRVAGGSFHFVLHHREWSRGSGDIEAKPYSVFVGLIIELVDQRLQTYRRIGTFRHVLGYLLRPCEFHEFDDWERFNHERYTITII